MRPISQNRPAGEADRSGKPERGAGVQALNLTLVEDDHACREEGDACRHGSNQTDGIKTARLYRESRMMGDFDGEDSADRCRKRDKDVGAKPCCMGVPFPFETDACAASNPAAG